MKKKRVKWTRSDNLAVLGLYLEAGRVRLPGSDPRVIKLASLIPHSASSINMKMGNFVYADPQTNSAEVGLLGGGKESKELMAEYIADPAEVGRLAAKTYSTIGRQMLDRAEGE